MWQTIAERCAHKPALFALIVFAFVLARYALLAGGFYVFFRAYGPSRYAARKIQTRPTPSRERDEIRQSLRSVVVQSAFAGFLFLLFDRGHLQIYLSVAKHGAAYFAFSIVLLFVWHDVYFYWSHRLLHVRRLYQFVHIVHHRSRNPTALAALSFHPVEAFLEVAFLAPFLMVVPMHPSALLIFLLVTHVFNITGHLGYELAPRGTWDRWWGRWITTNTHHNLHHQYPNGNFALYVRLWDSFFGTLHGQTGTEFRRVTRS